MVLDKFLEGRNLIAKKESIGMNGLVQYNFLEDCFTETYWIRVSKKHYLKSNLPMIK